MARRVIFLFPKGDTPLNADSHDQFAGLEESYIDTNTVVNLQLSPMRISQPIKKPGVSREQ
jgi:hypothetical protein